MDNSQNSFLWGSLLGKSLATICSGRIRGPCPPCVRLGRASKHCPPCVHRPCGTLWASFALCPLWPQTLCPPCVQPPSLVRDTSAMCPACVCLVSALARLQNLLGMYCNRLKNCVAPPNLVLPQSAMCPPCVPSKSSPPCVRLVHVRFDGASKPCPPCARFGRATLFAMCPLWLPSKPCARLVRHVAALARFCVGFGPRVFAMLCLPGVFLHGVRFFPVLVQAPDACVCHVSAVCWLCACVFAMCPLFMSFVPRVSSLGLPFCRVCPPRVRSLSFLCPLFVRLLFALYPLLVGLCPGLCFGFGRTFVSSVSACIVLGRALVCSVSSLVRLSRSLV